VPLAQILQQVSRNPERHLSAAHIGRRKTKQVKWISRRIPKRTGKIWEPIKDA